MSRKFKVTSEWVSNGHPDRCADLIAASVINEVYKRAAEEGKFHQAHAAIEVALTGGNDGLPPQVIIFGEATEVKPLQYYELEHIAKRAIRQCGYILENQKLFGKDNVLSAEDYDIVKAYRGQSPDIAQGVTKVNGGFNDQGIFFQHAECFAPTRQGYAHYLASDLGELLFDKREEHGFGPDIKTLCTISYDGEKPDEINHITVAIPLSGDLTPDNDVKPLIEEWLSIQELKHDNVKIIINGTGKYQMHGSKGDSGLTGRKLAVNFAGAYSRIGGGSPIKPIKASDRILPLFARNIALNVLDFSDCTSVEVACAGTIGRSGLDLLRIEPSCGTSTCIEYCEYLENSVLNKVSPLDIIEVYELDKRFDFDKVAFDNFFGGLGENLVHQPWENGIKIDEFIKRLG